MELTRGVGAKIYFDAAGVDASVCNDIDYRFKTGEAGSKLVLMGHGEENATICTETLISGYNVVVGSHGHAGVWRNVIRMVAAGLIDPRKMITRKITLEEAPEWLTILRTNKKEGKVVIVF